MTAMVQDPAAEQSPANLVKTQQDVPQPKDNEVLIKLTASSVNRIDLAQALGKYPPPPGFPKIGGLDCSGYIVDKDTLEPINADELCIALLPGGAYGQYAYCNKDQVIKVPKELVASMDAVTLAGIPEVWMTAFQILKFVAQVEENSDKRVLIWAAASGVGTSLIQLCKIMGLKSIAVASSKEKLDLCADLGASLCLNYKELSPEEFAAKVNEFGGADYVLDPVFGTSFATNMQCVNLDAKWVVYGNLGGFLLENFNMAPLFKLRTALLTTTLRGRSNDYKKKLCDEFSSRCLPLFADKTLRTIETSRFKLSKIADAMQVVLENRAIGKVLLEHDL